MTDLRAPFPWFGGKSRAAPVIWERFGDVVNYVEAFAGSLAVLLARPHEPRIETVNDLDCYLANFWRAMKEAPDEVARWADDPVNEADLHARHVWLVGQVEFRERMMTDPLFFDARIAGWWVWGLCAWIGSGWCDLGREKPSRQLPHIGAGGDGGASPTVGRGIHSGAYRAPSRQLPHLGDRGMGLNNSDTRTRIQEVFQALSARLRHTRVACGDFERVLSDSVTWRHGLTGILLDPEYPEGTQGLYGGKGAKDGEHVYLASPGRVDGIRLESEWRLWWAGRRGERQRQARADLVFAALSARGRAGESMVTRNTRQRPIKAVVLRVRAPSAARKEALRLRLETDAIEADGLTFVRPVTRRDCEGAPRPCPWVGCRHHLYLDIKRDGVKLNFPDLQPEDMAESCVLDAAERGGLTDLEVAARLNLVRSRIRQIEAAARAKVGPVLGRHRA